MTVHTLVKYCLEWHKSRSCPVYRWHAKLSDCSTTTPRHCRHAFNVLEKVKQFTSQACRAEQMPKRKKRSSGLEEPATKLANTRELMWEWSRCHFLPVSCTFNVAFSHLDVLLVHANINCPLLLTHSGSACPMRLCSDITYIYIYIFIHTYIHIHFRVYIYIYIFSVFVLVVCEYQSAV